jgi:cytoplasmic iron level regulating protein YaaA (DUF328/UPF0246 family)
MIVLLSPAKNLDFESEVPSNDWTEPRCLEESNYLIGKLQKLKPRGISKLMSLSQNLADLNYERYQGWSAEPRGVNYRGAAYAFNGEVYTGLDFESFTEEDRAYAQERLRLLSGLYGLLRPLDLIQPYRLEMGTSLKVTPKKTNLYKYWDGRIADLLEEDLSAVGSEAVINLASVEYFKSVKKGVVTRPIIACGFQESQPGGGFKTVMMYAKKARGLMAQYILKNRLENPEDLKGFDWEGYSFNEALSQDDNWLFTR